MVRKKKKNDAKKRRRKSCIYERFEILLLFVVKLYLSFFFPSDGEANAPVAQKVGLVRTYLAKVKTVKRKHTLFSLVW
jgi:hypothetical protein